MKGSKQQSIGRQRESPQLIPRRASQEDMNWRSEAHNLVQYLHRPLGLGCSPFPAPGIAGGAQNVETENGLPRTGERVNSIGVGREEKLLIMQKLANSEYLNKHREECGEGENIIRGKEDHGERGLEREDRELLEICGKRSHKELPLLSLTEHAWQGVNRLTKCYIQKEETPLKARMITSPYVNTIQYKALFAKLAFIDVLTKTKMNAPMTQGNKNYVESREEESPMNIQKGRIFGPRIWDNESSGGFYKLAQSLLYDEHINSKRTGLEIFNERYDNLLEEILGIIERNPVLGQGQENGGRWSSLIKSLPKYSETVFKHILLFLGKNITALDDISQNGMIPAQLDILRHFVLAASHNISQFALDKLLDLTTHCNSTIRSIALALLCPQLSTHHIYSQIIQESAITTFMNIKNIPNNMIDDLYFNCQTQLLNKLTYQNISLISYYFELSNICTSDNSKLLITNQFSNILSSGLLSSDDEVLTNCLEKITSINLPLFEVYVEIFTSPKRLPVSPKFKELVSKISMNLKSPEIIKRALHLYSVEDCEKIFPKPLGVLLEASPLEKEQFIREYVEIMEERLIRNQSIGMDPLEFIMQILDLARETDSKETLASVAGMVGKCLNLPRVYTQQLVQRLLQRMGGGFTHIPYPLYIRTLTDACHNYPPLIETALHILVDVMEGRGANERVFWKGIDQFVTKTFGGIMKLNKNIYHKFLNAYPFCIETLTTACHKNPLYLENGLRLVIELMNGRESTDAAFWKGIELFVKSNFDNIMKLNKNIRQTFFNASEAARNSTNNSSKNIHQSNQNINSVEEIENNIQDHEETKLTEDEEIKEQNLD